MFKRLIMILTISIISGSACGQENVKVLYLYVGQDVPSIQIEQSQQEQIYFHVGESLLDLGLDIYEDPRGVQSALETTDDAMRVFKGAKENDFTFAVVLSVAHDSNQTAVGTEEITRAKFELFDVFSQQLLEQKIFENVVLRPEAQGCNKECLKPVVRKNINIILAKMDNSLTEFVEDNFYSQAAYSRSEDSITLTFDGFFPNEHRAVTDRLIDVDGIQEVSLVKQGRGQAIYVVYGDHKHLRVIDSKLNQILWFLGHSAQMKMANSDFEIRKNNRSLAYLN
ncbi:hypothetical protein [Terasakiella sp.]|uniref:hypothetical protein n=1 Tax=Terasakiella sp. TaxID=2034861 RepID=UPI003AA7D716